MVVLPWAGRLVVAKALDELDPAGRVWAWKVKDRSSGTARWRFLVGLGSCSASSSLCSMMRLRASAVIKLFPLEKENLNREKDAKRRAQRTVRVEEDVAKNVMCL